MQMVYPVSWSAVCYVTVITLFMKKVGVVRPNFGGPDPRPPNGCALGITGTSVRQVCDIVHRTLFRFVMKLQSKGDSVLM